MIDMRIKNKTILKEREIGGCGIDLMTETLTATAYVLDILSEGRESYEVLRNIFADAVKRLEYGNMRYKNHKREKNQVN